MNQSRKLMVKDSPKTTAKKVSVRTLPQVLQMLSKSEKGLYRYAEEGGLAPGEKRRDKPAMRVKLERDTIAEFAIPTLLLSGYPASTDVLACFLFAKIYKNLYFFALFLSMCGNFLSIKQLNKHIFCGHDQNNVDFLDRRLSNTLI